RMGIRPRKPEVLDAFGERIVAGFRFLLAGSALLIVYLDPFEPSPLIPSPTVSSPSTPYTARSVEAFSRTWVIVLTANDILIYSLFISLSGGANSIFFVFYFVAIIAACS